MNLIWGFAQIMMGAWHWVYLIHSDGFQKRFMKENHLQMESVGISEVGKKKNEVSYSEKRMCQGKKGHEVFGEWLYGWGTKERLENVGRSGHRGSKGHMEVIKFRLYERKGIIKKF